MVYLALVVALMAPVGQAGDGPPGGHPVIVVDEDFDDSVANGFFTGTGGNFGVDGRLGQIVDDGTGNMVYEISEQQPTQAFLPVPARDFRLTLDATSLLTCENDDCSFGIPGFLFRANPSDTTGYFMDSLTLFEIDNPTPLAVARDRIGQPAVGTHTYVVSAIGDHIRVFRDGRQILSVFHDGPREGHIALVEVNGGVVWVDNVKLSLIPRSEDAG